MLSLRTDSKSLNMLFEGKEKRFLSNFPDFQKAKCSRNFFEFLNSSRMLFFVL